MNLQVVIRPSASKRNKPLLESDYSVSSMVRTNQTPTPTQTPTKGKKIGEAAGGAAADCAAVCCCCPCTVMNLVVLAVYKVPSRLCRKAWNNKKRSRITSKRQTLLAGSMGEDSVTTKMDPRVEFEEAKVQRGELQTEEMELEKEMWEQFLGTGFWRSPSQRSSS